MKIESNNKMHLISTFITYDRRKVFLLGLTIPVILFLLLTPCILVADREQNNRITEGNDTIISQQSENNSSRISFLTFREPDLGIRMQYPSDWTKQEDNLELHTIAAFFLIHTDLRDRTNITFAELDIRIYAQNTNDILSEIRQINNYLNVVISNSYNNLTAYSGFFVLRGLDKQYGTEQLQVWNVIPTKHILVELVYIADPLDYSHYLPVAKKIMQSLEMTD